MNLELILRARDTLKKALRSFFDQHGYLEVDTPVAVPLPGIEIHLEFFATQWRDYQGIDHQLFLRSSPEPQMKQLLCAARNTKMFQIAPCFRNHGELSKWHHPEFTMVEWYEPGIGFEDFIARTEELLRYTLEDTASKLNLPMSRGITFPARRMSVAEAFREFARVRLVDRDVELAKTAKSAGVVSVKDSDNYETAFFKILIEKIEPALARLGTVILDDYPASQCALAKVERRVAKRFEFYVNGIELCNGFEEKSRWQENASQLELTKKRRAELGKRGEFDSSDFESALKGGLPPSCGNALGFDRWLALILGHDSIDEVIPLRQGLPFGNNPYFKNLD